MKYYKSLKRFFDKCQGILNEKAKHKNTWKNTEWDYLGDIENNTEELYNLQIGRYSYQEFDNQEEATERAKRLCCHIANRAMIIFDRLEDGKDVIHYFNPEIQNEPKTT